MAKTVLSVIAFIGWIAAGVVFLRIGVRPRVWEARQVPSYARRTLIVTGWFLLFVVTECVLALKMGLSSARLDDFLLLRDLNLDYWISRFQLCLGAGYLLYLCALVVPNSWLESLRDLSEPASPGSERPLGVAVDVSAEWTRRCAKFRSRNRRWVIAGITWFSTVSAVAILSNLGIVDVGAYLYAGVLFLILAGLVAIVLASMVLPSLLVCPNCGSPPCRNTYNVHRWLDQIALCESCGARLA